MAEKGNRWWEFYFVRYLIGTITGALIISYLTLNNKFLNDLIITETSSKTWSEILKSNYWIFILLGFAYCYIASAPILVLHTCRAYLKNENGELNKITKIFSTIAYLLILLILALSLIFDLQCNKTHWVLLIIILIIQSILILLGINQNKISIFYAELTASRKLENLNKNRDNYIESYKHLREHGNAFSILMTELALGFILINLKEVNHLIIIISLWILPALYVWLIGSSLEFNIINNQKNT